MSTQKAATVKPVADDVPLSRAWQEGRRIYIRCGKWTELDCQLVELRARWDPEKRARWVGTQRRDTVLPLIRDAEFRRRAMQEPWTVEWLSIPYHMKDVREKAKELGAVWNRDRREWAFPSKKDQLEISRLISARRIQEDEAQKRARQAELRREWEAVRRHEQKEKERREQEKRAEIIRNSGRTPTGEETTLKVVSTKKMNKAQALAQGHEIGSVVKLSDGRRGIVVAKRAWFTDEEAASSVCWHDQTHDEAHWDIDHTVLLVEPTEEELTQDAREREAAEDAAELHQLAKSAAHWDASPEDQWHDVKNHLGRIECFYGSVVQEHNNGSLYLLGEAVVYRHPGYYDSYCPVERVSRDPQVIEQMRRLLEQGPRTRYLDTQTTYKYVVFPGQD